MRLIFIILIGLVAFNGSLIIFSEYFPFPDDTTPLGAKNVTDPSAEYAEYKNIDEPLFADPVTLLVTGGGIFAGIGIVAFFMKGSIPMGQLMGIGLIITIISTLWVGATTPIVALTKMYGGEMIYSLLVIIIGIVTTISLAEIFTGKGDEY